MANPLTATLERTRASGAGFGRRVIILGAVIVAEFFIALAAAAEPSMALSLVLLLAVAVIALVFPTPLLVAAFPATLAYWRVGPASVDMSVADAVTIVAVLAAIPYVPWKNRQLRLTMLLVAFYIATVAVSAFSAHSPGAVSEMLHRILMTFGPLLIGAAVAMLGRVRTALVAYVGVCFLVSLVAIANSLESHFSPAYPLGMQKNFAGGHLACGLLIIIGGASYLRLPRSVLVVSGLVIAAGLFATQSRGAALAFVAGSTVLMLRSRNRRLARIAPVLLVLSISFLIYAIVSFQGRDSDESDRFSSRNLRVSVYEDAIENAFKPHVPFGAGPRWFIAQGAGLPHQLVIAELSETGVFGTLALTVVLISVVLMLWRLQTQVSMIALLVVTERIAGAMLDLFWVAGTVTLGFLVIGMAFGDAEATRQDELAEAEQEQRMLRRW